MKFFINILDMSRIFLLFLLLALASCAYPKNIVLQTLPTDPFQNWNRRVLSLNNIVFKIVNPILHGYRAYVPIFIQNITSNFFNNLSQPFTEVLLLIQLRPKAAENAFGRFLTNTTLGLGGFLDWASPAGHPYQSTTLNLTLASYGVPSGAYIVLPLLGPSTIRDSISTVIGSLIDPFSLINNYHIVAISNQNKIRFYTIYWINKSAHILPFYESMQSASIDFYESLRDFYSQNQRNQIKKILSERITF